MASEKSFESGDVVVLKSGGPNMVVRHIGTMYDDDAVVCEWFAGGKLEQQDFNPLTLELADEE